MTFDRYGETGPTVVLLHGIPGWRGTFFKVGEHLGRTCRIVVPDLLGFGDSDDAPRHAHASEHAEAIIGLLEAIGVDRFHLVGFDFGGPTAIRIAGRLRGKVQSLTIAAANIFPNTAIPAPLRIARIPIFGSIFFRVAFGKLGIMMMWFAAVANRAEFPFSGFRAALRGHGIRSTRRIFLDSLRDLPGRYTEVAQIGRSLELPSLVLWGDSDPFFPLPVGKRTATALGADLRIIEQCGHFVPEEWPELVAVEIQRLVDRSNA